MRTPRRYRFFTLLATFCTFAVLLTVLSEGPVQRGYLGYQGYQDYQDYQGYQENGPATTTQVHAAAYDGGAGGNSGAGNNDEAGNDTAPDGDDTGLLPFRPQWSAAVEANASNLPLKCLNSVTPPHCYSPQQLQRAYSVTPLLDAGITGKGRSITLIEAFHNPTLQADLALFDTVFGLKEANVTVLNPFGVTPFNPKDSSQTGFAGESALDVEWAHALAPDAAIYVIETNPDGNSLNAQIKALLKATLYAVQNNIGDVISQSFGLSEECIDPALIRESHRVFQLARAQGQSVFAAAGDNGSAVSACPQTTKETGIAQGVNYPASDPLVTSVGGTRLNAGTDGTYLSEVTWNETMRNSGATGGGISRIFPRPYYQAQLATQLMAQSAAQGRALADIAFDGDPLTGVPIVTSSLSPGRTLLLPIGGTSLGSPALAAITTLFAQAAGHRLGFLNDALYRIAQDPTAYTATFHDITMGNNTFFFRIASLHSVVSYGKVAGYDATTGWDAPTGLGSLIADAMSTTLPRYIHPDDGSEL